MPQFEAMTSSDAGRVVVSLVGECDMTVRDELAAALLAGVEQAPHVVANLGGVTFLDSTGVHALVTAYHAARDRGGVFYAVGAHGIVAEILDLTGVSELLRPPVDGSGDPATGHIDGGN
jgi:anti-anti-sigma factor